jgi:hypothetical protein
MDLRRVKELGIDPIEAIFELEALKELKARYFRLLDTKDWAGWTQVWAPQIDHEMVTEGQAHRGSREDFVAFVSGALAGVVTVHHGHTPELELTSPTTARGIWAFVDRLEPGPDAHPMAPHMNGWGHYHESYVKSGDGWQIATQKVTRLRLDSQTPTAG